MTRLPWFVACGLAIALMIAGLEWSAPARAHRAADPLATSQAVQTRVAERRAGDAEETPTPTRATSANEENRTGEQLGRPDGIPSTATKADVVGHVDGDKIRIRIGSEEREVLLLGLDAPEVDEGPLGECYAEEAADRLEELVPRRTTIYLEKDESLDEDNKDRLLRFVWVDDDGDAANVNLIMLREGFGSLDSRGEETVYRDELEEAQSDARDDGEGLWDACGENHVELVPPTAIPTLVGSAGRAVQDTVGGAGRAGVNNEPSHVEEELTEDEEEETNEAPDTAQGFSAEEQEYADTVVAQTRLVRTSLERASELLTNPQIGDETWTIQLAAALATLQVTYTEASQLTPPLAFQEIHSAYVLALGYYDTAADNIATGLDTLDPSYLELARTNLELGNEQLAEATRLLDELREERGA